MDIWKYLQMVLKIPKDNVVLAYIFQNLKKDMDIEWVTLSVYSIEMATIITALRWVVDTKFYNK